MCQVYGQAEGICRSILSAAKMRPKWVTEELTAFSLPLSLSQHKRHSPQFHLSERPHRPFLLPLCCLPSIYISFPSEMKLFHPVLWSSPCVSLCPLLLQCSISSPLHLSGFQDQLLKSAFHFSPQPLPLWIGIIQSENLCGWKRPLRSSKSPTINPGLPQPPPNHISKCHFF